MMTNPTPTFNVLIYGPPGVGKTVLACSASESKRMRDVLLVDFENGSLSVASKITKGDIKKLPCKSALELEEILWKIANKDKEFSTIKTVVIDSVTELQQLDLMHISATAVQNKKRSSVDELQQRDYGLDTSKLKRLFRMARDLGINVIFLAHSKEKRDDNQKLLGVVPSLTDKLEMTLSGFVDAVWFLDVVDGVRKLAVKPLGVIRAKTRGSAFPNSLPDIVDNPNMSNLFAKLLELEYNIKEEK